MKKQYLLLLLVASLILYIALINFLSSFHLSLKNNQSDTPTSLSSTQVELNMGNSLGVSIVRNRWYGKIYEVDGSRTIYLFKLIKLPLEKNGKDYLLFHILFLFVWSFFLLKILYIKEYPEVQNFQETKDLNSLNF